MSLSFWEFIKRLLRSHLAHVLLAVSWCFILFEMIRLPMEQPMFTGCIPAAHETIHFQGMHFVYPIWHVAIYVAHLPSMLLTLVISKFFQGVFALDCGSTAMLELAIFFLFSSIQWLLLGHGIESLCRWLKSRKQRSQQALAADSPVGGL